MPQCRMLLEQAGDATGASTLFTFQNEAIEAVTRLARDLKRWGDNVRGVGANAKQVLAQARGVAISAGWPASVITAALATHSATDNAIEAAVAVSEG